MNLLLHLTVTSTEIGSQVVRLIDAPSMSSSVSAPDAYASPSYEVVRKATLSQFEVTRNGNQIQRSFFPLESLT